MAINRHLGWVGDGLGISTLQVVYLVATDKYSNETFNTDYSNGASNIKYLNGSSNCKVSNTKDSNGVSTIE